MQGSGKAGLVKVEVYNYIDREVTAAPDTQFAETKAHPTVL